MNLIRTHAAHGCIVHYLELYDCFPSSEKTDFELLKLQPISVDKSVGTNIADTVSPLVSDREAVIVLLSLSLSALKYFYWGSIVIHKTLY